MSLGGRSIWKILWNAFVVRERFNLAQVECPKDRQLFGVTAIRVCVCEYLVLASGKFARRQVMPLFRQRRRIVFMSFRADYRTNAVSLFDRNAMDSIQKPLCLATVTAALHRFGCNPRVTHKIRWQHDYNVYTTAQKKLIKNEPDCSVCSRQVATPPCAVCVLLSEYCEQNLIVQMALSHIHHVQHYCILLSAYSLPFYRSVLLFVCFMLFLARLCLYMHSVCFGHADHGMENCQHY